jgi:DNA relaxase NicK
MTVHWLRGGFDLPISDVLDLVSSVTESGCAETFDWGRMMYRKHHTFVGGLTVYEQPVADNMPPVLVDVPGAACEFLGLERLRVLFCNSTGLSRADVAYDGAAFTPRDMAAWARAGNIRTRAANIKFREAIRGEGETLEIGSRSSERYVRAYDARGFTRVELELKGDQAGAFQAVLLAPDDEFVASAVGVLRAVVDFVDASSSSNISRAKLLPSWEAFTAGLEKVKLMVAAATVPTVERVQEFIENQVASTLVVYLALGNSLSLLLKVGEEKLKPHHRSVLAFAGVSV